MRIPPRLTVTRIHPVFVVALLCLTPLARAQDSETITATASVTSAGGVAATAPVTVLVDRFATDSERDEILAALKEDGTEGVRRLLTTRNPIGSVTIGAAVTPIKYTYGRTTGGGRPITAVTGSSIAFIGSAAPAAKPRAGFDRGLILLDLAGSGTGTGELVPATTVRLDDKGAIVTEDYSAEVVKLSSVVRK